MTKLITFCSVSYNSRLWLEESWALTHALNPGTRVRWLVAENSPADSIQRLPGNNGHFQVFPGTTARVP